MFSYILLCYNPWGGRCRNQHRVGIHVLVLERVNMNFENKTTFNSLQYTSSQMYIYFLIVAYLPTPLPVGNLDADIWLENGFRFRLRSSVTNIKLVSIVIRA